MREKQIPVFKEVHDTIYEFSDEVHDFVEIHDGELNYDNNYLIFKLNGSEWYIEKYENCSRIYLERIGYSYEEALAKLKLIIDIQENKVEE